MKGKLFDHFLNIFWKCTQPFTVLQNLNQHQLSVFLITIYNISKRATSLIYRMVCFSFSGAPNGMGHIWPPVQKSKKIVKKLERKYYTNNLCITYAVQNCTSSIHYILQLFFEKLKLKFWVWKKACLDTPMQSEQSIQICFLYVQTKYKF